MFTTVLCAKGLYLRAFIWMLNLFPPQDICRRAQDCVVNPVVEEVLTHITYIGVTVSCIGLIITVITLLMFK